MGGASLGTVRENRNGTCDADETLIHQMGDDELMIEPRQANPFGIELAGPAFFCFQFVAGFLIPQGSAGFLADIGWADKGTGLSFNKVYRFFTYALPFVALGTTFLGVGAESGNFEVAGGTAIQITTSIVVNNPTGAPVDGSVVFLDPQGGPLQLELDGVMGNNFEFQVPATSSLPPFGSLAGFVLPFVGLNSAASPAGSSGIFEGSLVITSNTDLAVISLQTLHGFQLSSLPGGILQVP